MKLLRTLRPNRFDCAGFTLIEIIIAIAIIALISTVGLVVGLDQYRAYSLQSDTTTVVSMIQKARNRAMNNIGNSMHGFYTDYSDYIVFRGTSYASRNADYDEIIPKSGPVSLSGDQEFVFGRLSGEVSNDGTLTITNGVSTREVEVDSEGKISW